MTRQCVVQLSANESALVNVAKTKRQWGMTEWEVKDFSHRVSKRIRSMCARWTRALRKQPAPRWAQGIMSRDVGEMLGAVPSPCNGAGSAIVIADASIDDAFAEEAQDLLRHQSRTCTCAKCRALIV